MDTSRPFRRTQRGDTTRAPQRDRAGAALSAEDPRPEKPRLLLVPGDAELLRMVEAAYNDHKELLVRAAAGGTESLLMRRRETMRPPPPPLSY